jgi:hypothetical protein
VPPGFDVPPALASSSPLFHVPFADTQTAADQLPVTHDTKRVKRGV